MRWLGLTGGIATGKSTVAALIKGRGIPIVDADAVSKEITQAGSPALEQIRLVFGPEVFKLNSLGESELDRLVLGKRIFSDPQQRADLESILHPLIRARVQQLRKDLEGEGHALAFYDVPLLFEKKMQSEFDEVVVVYAPSSLQLTRLMARNSLTESEARERIEAQLDIELKRKLANYVVDNSSDIHFLGERVDLVLSTILKKVEESKRQG